MLYHALGINPFLDHNLATIGRYHRLEYLLAIAAGSGEGNRHVSAFTSEMASLACESIFNPVRHFA
jgi:hypothetical protein